MTETTPADVAALREQYGDLRTSMLTHPSASRTVNARGSYQAASVDVFAAHFGRIMEDSW